MIYVLTTETYDRYNILGVFEGEPGIDVANLAAKWAKEFPENTKNIGSTYSGKKYFDADHFRQYVMKETGLKPLPYDELWLPDYSLDMKRTIEAGNKQM